MRTFRLIVHYPETAETQRELAQKTAAVHAQTVMETIGSLPCCVKRKAELIDAVSRIYQKGDGL